MARKSTENPSLDMTPMIDVVFELIIFFVVTLKMAVEKDETIQLEDGKHGIELTADELPPSHLVIDIAKNGRISMCNVTITPSQVSRRVKERKMKWGDQFPVLIRADYRAKHKYVKEVMDACTQEGVWKLSFVAVYDRKSGKQLTK
jgi:biopolymer transport protein ExbD